MKAVEEMKRTEQPAAPERARSERAPQAARKRATRSAAAAARDPKQLRAEVERLRGERDAATAAVEAVAAKLAQLPGRSELTGQLEALDRRIERAGVRLDGHTETLTLRQRLRDQAEEQLRRYTEMRDFLYQQAGGEAGVVEEIDSSPEGLALMKEALLRGPVPPILLQYAEARVEEAKARLEEMELELAEAKAEKEAAGEVLLQAQQDREAAAAQLEEVDALTESRESSAASAWSATEQLRAALQELGVEPLEPRDDGAARERLHRRYPRELPEYLRITVGRSELEPAAERVVRRLETARAEFRPHEHLPELQALVGRYGIAASLVEVLDRVNRSRQGAVARRILALTYPYTLHSLLQQIVAQDLGGEDSPAARAALRDIVKDTVGFVNRVRDHQRGDVGESPASSPQQIFADAFVEEVSVRQRLRLPTGSAARKELRARVLASL